AGQPFLQTTIVPGFSVVPGTIQTNKGTTDLSGNVLSWFVSQVATESIFLKYSIVVDNSSVCGTQNPEDTVIKYENPNCEPVTESVPSPDICVPCPTLDPNISQQGCGKFIDYSAVIQA